MICHDVVDQYGVCVRIMGNMSFVPPHVVESMKKAVEFSRHNNRLYLNIAFSYTSTQEMNDAGKMLCQGITNGQLQQRLNNQSVKIEI